VTCSGCRVSQNHCNTACIGSRSSSIWTLNFPCREFLDLIDSSKYFAGKALALTANTQKSFWKQVILFYSKDAMTYPSPPAPPQSWVVPSTLGNTWKSQLSTYIGCPGSVRTSRHLDSGACVTRCPGHHGHPRTCQDTYQDILGVWNSPGHSSCPELSTKSWLLWSNWTCTM